MNSCAVERAKEKIDEYKVVCCVAFLNELQFVCGIINSFAAELPSN